MITGEVKYFNEVKGFGFLKGSDGRDYFMHILDHHILMADNGSSEFLKEGAGHYPAAGEKIIFNPAAGEKGPRAMPWAFVSGVVKPKKAANADTRPKAAESKTKYRVRKLRILPGGKTEEMTVWKGSLASLLKKHPLPEGNKPDSLAPGSRYQETVWFEVNHGKDWERCEDPRPVAAILYN